MIKRILCLLLGVAALSPKFVGAEAPRIVVFTIEDKTKNLKPNQIQQLTDYLTGQIAEGGSFYVIPSSEVKERLVQEKKESYKACYDQKCQIEIGRELAAQKSLATQILKVGSKCAVVTTLYDLKRAATEKSATERCVCDQDALVDTLEKVVTIIKRGSVVSIPQKGTTPEEVTASVARGGLTVKSDPSGAHIWLDNRKIEGVTPFVLRDLTAGPHMIELRYGFLQKIEKVTVLRDRFVNVMLKLQTGKGRLEVVSDPLDAKIFIDGELIGKTPKIFSEAAAGSHVVELRMHGYVAIQKKITLPVAGNLIVNEKLEQTGFINVDSNPQGGLVFVDGQQIGRTPFKYHEVAPGKHKVLIEMRDRFPIEKEVIVEPTKTVLISSTLVLTETAKQRIAQEQARQQAAAEAARKRAEAEAKQKAEEEKQLQIKAQKREAAAAALYKEAMAKYEKALQLVRPTYRSKSIWGYTTIGTGVALAIGAGILYGVGISQGDTAYNNYSRTAWNDQIGRDAFRSDMDSAKTQLIVGHVLIGTSAVVLGYSIYQFISRPSLPTKPESESTDWGDDWGLTATLTPIINGASFSLNGQF